MGEKGEGKKGGRNESALRMDNFVGWTRGSAPRREGGQGKVEGIL